MRMVREPGPVNRLCNMARDLHTRHPSVSKTMQVACQIYFRDYVKSATQACSTLLCFSCGRRDHDNRRLL